MAITRVEYVRRIFVSADPTSTAIPGVAMPGDLVNYEGTDYLVTQTGVVLNGGTLFAPASTAARASLNIGNDGTAPDTPADGDIWIESDTIKARLNGATVTITTS